MIIRPMRPDDLLAVQDIERSAGEQFRDIGMPEIADDDPFTIDELTRYLRTGLAWVAADPDDRPVAYLIADPVDGCLHIEQVSVDRRHARQGLGRRLIDHLAAHAAAARIPALTLTTFTEVPWNAPYYRRCGFRQLGSAEITPGLRAVRAHEAALGLDRWPRACMRRTVEWSPAGSGT
ncbi:GCN5 family N-acetyltransferase [Actinoplanes sp. SE50]|uniref:GNAT family N-acetyltransferase n=1 Tax=unclassified Actinoplanes TaxID=2626549 RepID=UPI00023EC11E|nr:MULTISPECIES: GNAT family N-acetyltransferase [unclassified Actinoplanes]AEV85778.1 GCN5-related N-acetyltransferase [Actinoplanes sp. SE50/110]ATO84172.1 GCN5 family N-acetyltransferase [Actinoplanes sp. SE50]SLM01582.1 GCN5 family N-acetyltransferase [Actinoplanes sp. SE50/110]